MTGTLADVPTYGPKRRERLLRLPIGELAGWHMVAVCGTCRQERIVHISDLVLRYGPGPTLAQIAPRLRCARQQCRQPAIKLRLRNRFPVHPGPALIDVVLIDRRPAPR